MKRFLLLAVFLVIALVVTTRNVSAGEGYGWVNPDSGSADCGGGLSKVRFETRRRDNDASVNAGNIRAEIYNGSGTLQETISGAGNTSTSGCIYEPVNGYIKVWVDGGGGYNGLFTQFRVFNPTNWVNKSVVFHIHVQPVGEVGAVKHESPPASGWFNNDPNIIVSTQNFTSAHGANATTKIILDIQGPTNVIREVPGLWGAGQINLGSQGLADGWYNWGFFANDNLTNFSISAWSGFQSFGKDTQLPINVTATHQPSSPTSTQDVTIYGHAEDGISGLDYIEVFVDGVSKQKCEFDGNLSGDCNPNVGKYAAGSTHNYRVYACDRAGNCKDATGSFTVQGPPADPSGLSATPGCAFNKPKILFSWTDNATDETGYRLEVTTTSWSSNPTHYGATNLSANTTSYDWDATKVLVFVDDPASGGLVPVAGQQYWWRVKALKGGVDGNYKYPPNSTSPPGTSVTALSNCAPASPSPTSQPSPIVSPSPSPSAVPVATVDVFCEHFTVNWSPVTGATLYQLEVTRNGGAPSTISNISGTSYTFFVTPGIDTGATYTARVRSTSPTVSAWSNTVTAIIPACEPPTNLQVAVSCDASANPVVTFTWNAPTDTAVIGYRLEVNPNSSYSPFYGRVDINGRTTVSFVWSQSSQISAKAPPKETTFFWRLSNRYASFASGTFVDGPSFKTPSCVLDDYFSLELSTACDVNNRPTVTINWRGGNGPTSIDTPTGYWLDVNGAAWTGPSGPSPWAVKTVAHNSSDVNHSFVWSSANPMDVGDVDPSAAGDQQVPISNDTIWVRIKAFNSLSGLQGPHVYYKNGAYEINPPGNSFTVANCAPSNPGPLSVSTSCSNGLPVINFTWTASSRATGYYVDVNTSAWTADDAPWPWGYKTITSAATTTFSWSAASTMTSGTPLAPANGVTYWWRVQAFNSNTKLLSQHVYPPNTTTPPGTSFVAPNCALANPTSLTLAMNCDATGLPQVVFGWTDNATGETTYYLDVTSDVTWTGWDYKTLGANANGFTWDSANALDGFGSVPASGDQFYWRVRAYNSTIGAWSQHVYYTSGGGTTALPGDLSTVITCQALNPPSQLSVSTACNTSLGVPEVTFSWVDNETTETNYYVEVSTSSAWTAMGRKITPSNTTSYVWKAADPLTGGPPIVPANGASYYFRVRAYNSFSGLFSPATYYKIGPGDNAIAPGDPFTTPDCSPPANPGGLTVNQSCISSTQPSISFAWADNATNETTYYLDVATDWASGWSNVTLPAGSTTFVWSSASPLTLVWGSAPTVPANNLVFYWRVQAYNSINDTSSQHVYGGNTTPPGTAVTVMDCANTGFDIKVDIVPMNGQAFRAGDTMNVDLVVTNNGPEALAGGKLGAWNDFQAGTGPQCPGSGAAPVPGPAIDINGLGASGGTKTFPYSFTVPSDEKQYVLMAYALTDCLPAGERNWTDNIDTLTYNVTVDAWFVTTGGDVGSDLNITMPFVDPDLNRYQSDYVLVAGDLDKVSSQRWQLENYDKKLVEGTSPGAVYSYLAGKFITDAKKNTLATQVKTIEPRDYCRISDGDVPNPNPANPLTALMYCPGDAYFRSGFSIPSGDMAIFIEGDLYIENDFVLPASSAIAFAVKGNITVNTNVAKADGLYIAKGTFSDTNGITAGQELTVNGGVYANSVILGRKLGGACVGPCNNSTDPAEVLNFQVKYLLKMKDILGSPGIIWQEIQP